MSAGGVEGRRRLDARCVAAAQRRFLRLPLSPPSLVTYISGTRPLLQPPPAPALLSDSPKGQTAGVESIGCVEARNKRRRGRKMERWRGRRGGLRRWRRKEEQRIGGGAGLTNPCISTPVSSLSGGDGRLGGEQENKGPTPPPPLPPTVPPCLFVLIASVVVQRQTINKGTYSRRYGAGKVCVALENNPFSWSVIRRREREKSLSIILLLHSCIFVATA